MIKVIKKKNPHSNDIEKYIKNNSIDFANIGAGSEADVYLFLIDKSLILNTKILKPGEYVLKIYDNDSILSTKKLEKLELLSKYGLIPKIHIITKKYIVMKYIHGMILHDYINKYPYKMPDIKDKIDNLKIIWKKLGFQHDDLNWGNILVSDKESVYFIDPHYGNLK